MARIRISLSMDVPEDASREDVLAYVVDAVSSWRGSLRPPGGYEPDDPGDPMFGLDTSSVRASFVTAKGGKRRYTRCEVD